ncbi:hypothetical protein JKP88DRAFT_162137 [Tribonema minus]|uniref:SGNH hydrolase-type esterase domain-containing protein n=1 Tax=Tribonema minus TaxID=303371 RepID=A0A836CKM3_9STRA|nr:hypothetical protein JKP88DRAFT_162137 [Tribonema minus]
MCPFRVCGLHCVLVTAYTVFPLAANADTTNEQLEVLFQKCVTPGASITVGAVGGSITAGAGAGVGDENAYIHRIAASVQRFCPAATVSAVNAARGGTGSLTTGMCLQNMLGPHVDLLAMEFSLNDREQYTVGGEFSAAPYELLTRAALSAFAHAPALYGIFFWGVNFQHASAQGAHLAVARRYGVTGVSMRDVVWPCLDAASPPYATRDAVLADARHHPSAAVHAHLGDIVSLHIAEALQRWAAAAAAAPALRRDARALLPLAALPEPLAPELAQYDVLANTFHCELAGWPREGPGPSLYQVDGWRKFEMGARTSARLDSQQCVQATREGASLLLDGELRGRECACLCTSKYICCRALLGYMSRGSCLWRAHGSWLCLRTRCARVLPSNVH